MNSSDRELTAQEQVDVRKLFDAYKAKDPIVTAVVHEALGLKTAQPKTDIPSPSPVADQSVRDVKREAAAPDQRAARVAAIIEEGAIRDILTKAGVTEEAARTLEKELFSDKKEEQEKASRMIDKYYQAQGKGGYRTFLTEAKGRFGATAVVVSALIPLIVEIEK